MKTLFASLCVATTLASPAFALSCMKPDVARSFNWAAEADEAYVVLYGDFAFPPRPSRDAGNINAPSTAEVTAGFEGQALTSQGFRNTDPLELTVRLDCAGPWCGNIPASGTDMLAFVEQTDTGYVLTVGPCVGELFSVVSSQDLSTLEACMRGEACVAAPLR